MQTRLMAAMFVAFGLALTPSASLASGKDDHKDHKHEEKHSDHKSELKGMKALHAWTRAAHKGEDALVFVELENKSKVTILLQGGEAEYAKSVELVGFQLKDGEAHYLPIKQVPIKAGRHLELAPKALALRLNGLDKDLHKGDDLDIELKFDIGEMHVHVEIGAEEASQHSHAGHNHD